MSVDLHLHLKRKNCILVIIGNIILAFGLYNVHAQTCVTEGGVLGMMLLLKNLFNISPAYSGFVLDVLCFALGWKVLGFDFIGYSAVATVAFSISYKVFESFAPLWPQIGNVPWAAAIVGAVFVGIGAGLSVKAGGASGGDDALAMSLSKLTHIDIQWLYLISDVTVLALSLIYIPVQRIVWSLITVVLSGQIIGWIQKLKICG